MAVNTEADRVVSEARQAVQALTELWVGMVTETTSGASDFKTPYRREVFDKILALRDALGL